jgi:hypothetical protein
MTAIGSEPTTSKYTFPVELWPGVNVVAGMPWGVATAHNTTERWPPALTAYRFGMIGVTVPLVARTVAVASQSCPRVAYPGRAAVDLCRSATTHSWTTAPSGLESC